MRVPANARFGVAQVLSGVCWCIAVHMISLSTELDYSPGSAQYAFLTKDLQAVNRTNTPWLVANFHRPYVSASVSVPALCTLSFFCQLMSVLAPFVYCCESFTARLFVLTFSLDFALMHDLGQGPLSKGASKSYCSVLVCTAGHILANLCTLCFQDTRLDSSLCFLVAKRIVLVFFFVI